MAPTCQPTLSRRVYHARVSGVTWLRSLLLMCMCKHVVGVMSEVEIVAVDNRSDSRSSNSQGASQGVRVATFYHWKYNHYFKVVDEGDKNLKARCTLCSASAKTTLVRQKHYF